MDKASFDYIIIGAGAAGCVLANRLSAEQRGRVLLIESGGSDRHPMHLVPKGFYFTLNNPKYAKTFKTTPFPDGHTEPFVRGRVLGGSTTINGMVWNRGWAPFYDGLEAAGNKGWNWSRFLDAFRKIERHRLGGNDLRGGDGPVDIEVAGPREEACDTFISAMETEGIPYLEDMNSSGDQRVSYVAGNLRRGTRMSASRAFLRPARKRRNLTIVTGTTAEKLLLEGTRVTGVRCQTEAGPVTYHATREVLVAGGAFDSPLLLERSGIGNPEVLEAAGVPVLVPSPNVGENFSEHRGILLQYRLAGVRGYGPDAHTRARYLWSGFKYLFSRGGLVGHGAYTVSGIYKSDPAATTPDTQCLFTPLSTSAVNPMTGRLVVDSEPGAKYVVYPMYPTSRGSLHITGPGLKDEPRLDPNLVATEEDRRMIVLALRRAREIIAADPFGKHVVEELSPGPSVTEDDQIVDYAINKGVPGAHGLGTCRMGPDPDDPVDHTLRVRGTEGLRVIDASVLPGQPSGNNNAPTMALAWIAADLILADTGDSSH